LVWRTRDVPWRPLLGGGRLEGSGRVEVGFVDEIGRAALNRLGDVRIAEPLETTPVVAANCRVPSDGLRLDWSPVPLRNSALAIDQVIPGPDGCTEVVFSNHASFERFDPWYICTESEAWPFEAGRVVQLRNWRSVDTTTEALIVEELTPDGADLANRAMWIVRGAFFPGDLGIDVRMTPSTGPHVRDSCSSPIASAPIELTSRSRERIAMRSGDRAEITLDETTAADVLLYRSSVRPLVDVACTKGPVAGTADIEAIIHLFPR